MRNIKKILFNWLRLIPPTPLIWVRGGGAWGLWIGGRLDRLDESDGLDRIDGSLFFFFGPRTKEEEAEKKGRQVGRQRKK